MIRFNCDYAEGAHPRILERLSETNLMQTATYGLDEFSENARKLIRQQVGGGDVDIHFLVGGTQTNLTLIGSALRSYEGVIAAETGHIGVHETGAIESVGHKVLTVLSLDGKITSEDVRRVCLDHVNDPNHEHMVRPGMVYISQPTENGTLYSIDELTGISKACRECGLYLYIDGARLGYGLASPKSDFVLSELATLADAFYIGGTKQGALFGEALVICNEKLKENFRYSIKQRGAMLAKGRLLGLQFETLFQPCEEGEPPLYFQMSFSAIEKAMKIKNALDDKGVEYLYDSWTNQLFPIFSNAALSEFAKTYQFDVWKRMSESEVAVRICTSWATTDENTDRLVTDIGRIL